MCVSELSQLDTPAPRGLVTDLSPAAIVAYLDQYVVGQSQAKKVLAVAAYNHIKRCFGRLTTPVEKSNIWLIGPSGSGKTLLAHHLSKFLELPFASIDSTTITEAGYVGEDPEIVVAKLLLDADGDVKQAECGVIFIDEIDKLARSSGGNGGQRDIKGAGVQQSFLRMVEGDAVTVNPEGKKRNMNAPSEQVHTKNVLFILGGAFVGMREQMTRQGMGINKDLRQAAAKPVGPEDLTRYGMIQELVGRVPIIAELDPLTRDDLVRILTEPRDALTKQYQALLAADGVGLRFEPSFLNAVADLAIQQGTGARGLRAIMERSLLPIMFSAPSAKVEKSRVRQLREIALTAQDVRS